jgi:hypothetical protein
MCGAMVNYTDKAELSDLEAYNLVSAIRWGVDQQDNSIKVEVGRAFRESCRHFLFNVDDKSWEYPSKHRLEIDKAIKKLMDRNKDPYISQSKNTNSFALRHSSPYHLARIHLENFASILRNPSDEHEQAKVYVEFLDQINRAADALTPILMKPWWEIGMRQSHLERWQMEDLRKHTPTGANVIAIQDQLETALNALESLGKIIEAEFPVMQVQKAATGRPRLLWRDYFVLCMAHLWRLLTGCEPQQSEESLFGEFVRAAWNSFDDNMPEVKFAHTIRNLPDETGA